MEARTVLPGLALAAALAVSGPAAAAECWGQAGGDAAKLVLIADQVKSASGEVAFTVYPDNKNRFLARKGKLARLRVPAKAGSTTACFWLPPAVYAVAIYHDANGNQDFDRKFTGMPDEGYGFSNDASTSVGLPKFDSVRFRFTPEGGPMRMRMRY